MHMKFYVMYFRMEKNNKRVEKLKKRHFPIIRRAKDACSDKNNNEGWN